jgi:hypothetical protein
MFYPSRAEKGAYKRIIAICGAIGGQVGSQDRKTGQESHPEKHGCDWHGFCSKIIA